MADLTRRHVVEILARRPQSVGEIAAKLPVTRPAVSQHLKVLRECGLVRCEAVGQRNVYSLSRDGFGTMLSYVRGLWETALDNFAGAARKEEEERYGTRDIPAGDQGT